jgi:hypothetical protein
VYRHKDNNNEWVFDANEWEKDLQALSYRYSSYTKQNLDLRPLAKNNRVWLIDSISGYNIDNLLSQLIEFANDTVDSVPRVRAPIVRDRLTYVCNNTIEKVISPCLDISKQIIQDIIYAKDKLSTQIDRSKETILMSTSEVLRLEIKVLQSTAIPITMEDNVATALGISSLLDTQESLNAKLTGLLTQLANNLFLQIEKWKHGVGELKEIKDIYELHRYHQNNFRIAKKNMRINAIPEYTKWFASLENGRKWLSFLGIRSVDEILNNKKSFDDQIDTDNLDNQPQIERNISFNIEEVTESLINAFQEGTELIIRNANSSVENSLIAIIWERVCKILTEYRQVYTEKSIEITSGNENKVDENIESIINDVNSTRTLSTQRTVDTIKRDFNTTVGDIRGELLERGIATNLRIESEDVWQKAKEVLEISLDEIVKEKLEIPIRGELNKLRQLLSQELKMLDSKLSAYEDNVSEFFATDIPSLKSTEKTLVETAKDKTEGFTSSLQVFGAVESQSNYFEQHGIGDRFRAEMDSDLSTNLTIWENKKRNIQISLIASLVLCTLIVIVFLAPIGITLSGISEQVLYALLGIAFTGVLTFGTQLFTFSKKAKAELSKMVLDQLDKVSQQAIVHLGESERKEGDNFNATRITFQQLIEHFAYNGVQALFQHLMNQLRDRMDKFSNQVGSDQAQSVKRINVDLQSFRIACQMLLSQTAEGCGDVLGKKAFEIILENKKIIDDKFDDLHKKIRETEAIFHEAKTTLVDSIKLT